MNDIRLIELTDAEIDDVSGGFPWVAVGVGIFLAGAIVEGYNAYKEEKKAQAQGKTK